MPGLDLSDSDDDATWTPFKNKEERDRPVGVPNVVNQGRNVKSARGEEIAFGANFFLITI